MSSSTPSTADARAGGPGPIVRIADRIRLVTPGIPRRDRSRYRSRSISRERSAPRLALVRANGRDHVQPERGLQRVVDEDLDPVLAERISRIEIEAERPDAVRALDGSPEARGGLRRRDAPECAFEGGRRRGEVMDRIHLIGRAGG